MFDSSAPAAGRSRFSTVLLAAAIVAGAAASATAQQHDPSMHERHMRELRGGGPEEETSSPYVGLTERAIKSLSEEEVRSLRAGEGMGLALAAELNGYPGPKHVLELADALQLTSEQHESTQRIFDEMATDARDLGERLLEAEARLDRAFAERSIDHDRLVELTAAVASVRGRLRAIHLRAHLDMMDVLTEDQVASYARERGYIRR